MNTNNNAVMMQELIQRVNGDSKRMESISSGTQEKGQEVAKFSSLVPPIRDANLLSDVFPGENGFSSASVVPQQSTSLTKFHGGSPSVYQSNPPRPFHSPSRSFSMPGTSRTITYGQFNVTHVPPATLFSQHSTYPSGSLPPIQAGPTGPERYRVITNHSSHALPR